MDAVVIDIDAAMFSADVVARTAHRYTADFAVEVRSEPARWMVHLSPKAGRGDLTDVVARFRNDLLDDRLRDRVAAQTSALQAALTQAALHESLSKPARA